MILKLRIKYGMYHDMVKKNLLRGKLGVDIKNISHKIKMEKIGGWCQN